MTKVTLESVLSRVNDLPALPYVVVRVMELTEDQTATAQDINSALNQDQSMTAKVLKLANSAFYGFPRRISTVTDATIFLGFKTVRSIVLAAAVSEMLSKEVEGYAMDQGELWRHSQSVAIIARAIAKKVKFPLVDIAYTAGLLHDIGKVVLNSFMAAQYKEVLQAVEEDDLPFMDAEEQVLGFTHANVGSRIAEKWNLPGELVEAIAYHHEPMKATINPKLTAIVHIADVICLYMGIGMGVDGLRYPVSREAMELLGLDENDVEAMMSQLVDLFIETEGNGQ